MVRLAELQRLFFQRVLDSKFQFQYGAISGEGVEQDVITLQQFQFQYGAISGEIKHGIYPITNYISIPIWCN